MIADVGLVDVPHNQRTKRVAVDRFTTHGEKQMLLVLGEHEQGAHLAPVPVNPMVYTRVAIGNLKADLHQRSVRCRR